MKPMIYLSDFRREDDISTFSAAIDYLRDHPGTDFTIEPGIYTISSDLSREAQRAVMAGEWGSNPQRHMFNPRYTYTRGVDFDGISDCTVTARGVTLMIDGFMEPVSLRNCRRVEITGLTIDHVRKPYTRGIISAVAKDGEDLLCRVNLDDCITPATPLRLRDMIYDPKTDRNVHYGIKDVKFVDERTIELRLVTPEESLLGMEYYTVHSFHSRPAILIEHAEDITLTDVTIHSQPGMGVVGNRSHNVVMRRLWVIPSPSHAMSTNTDATHFTSMTGVLRFEACVFEGQGDDFTNVHGYYQAIIQRIDGRTCIMQEKTPDGTHAQSLDYPDVGDTLELVDYHTLKVLDHFTVEHTVPMAEDWCCQVTLDHDLPENTDGLMLADVTRLPFLEVVGCTAARHYARSVLIKTRGALIEDNCFRDVYGPAIVAAAESWWYEGVCPADVTIRRNRILNCANRWGEAAGIVVKADADRASGQSIRNIVIEDNLIDSRDSEHGIYLRNIDGVTLRRNTVCTRGVGVVVEDSVNVTGI